ncbi:MAG: MBL fold metallo-hydrolase [Cyanobacteria bacterium P01_A01_bin.3]
MLRRSVAAISGLALASGVGGSLTVAIAQPEAIEFETQAITDNIQVLMGGGGNVGVFSGDDGVFLIDDSLAPATDQLLAAVAEISDSPIEYVISTHWHFDHTGGNEALGETGTLIVAHDNVRERMSVDVFIESINQEFPASPDVALPVITFNDAVTFHLNGESVNVFHVEGAHTDGDAIVHFPDSNVIHMGDTYFNGFYPFIDLESGGSLDGVIATADQLVALADSDTTIIPGHGPLSNVAQLEIYRDMLVDVRDRTSDAIADGMTLDEFLASDPTADLDDAWGGGFMNPESFQTIVYTDLAN